MIQFVDDFCIVGTQVKTKFKVNNFEHSVRLLSMTTLRNILGTRTLAQCLSDKETIQCELLRILDEATDPWGIKVNKLCAWQFFKNDRMSGPQTLKSPVPDIFGQNYVII